MLHACIYHRHIKFCGLNFHVFDWQENLWGINFRGHGSVVGMTVVGFAKYASYCGLIFVDKRHTTKSTKISMHTVASIWHSVVVYSMAIINVNSTISIDYDCYLTVVIVTQVNLQVLGGYYLAWLCTLGRS